MRISDWSSDVCSSDLRLDRHRRRRWHLFVLGVHPSLLHPSLFRWRIGGGGFIVSRAEEGDLEAVRPALGVFIDRVAAAHRQGQHQQQRQQQPEREERRGGRKGVGTCTTSWSPYDLKQPNKSEKNQNKQ